MALNPAFRFDAFVVGAGNRLAATAARAVAEAPGAMYNPLVIHAASGLGKTHLLTAIGHAAAALDPGLEVAYLTLDAYAPDGGDDDPSAGALAALARPGLLLLDDLQLASGRRATQAELLRLLDEMQVGGRQVVLASDRMPGDITGLDERLRRRLGGGLVVEIGPPEFDTRLAIVRQQAADRRVSCAPGVLEAVAAVEVASVRDLLAAVHQLAARGQADQAVLTPMAAHALVAGAASSSSPPPPALAGDPEAPTTVMDEFADFLSEISSTVSQQVEAWRARVAAAVLHWGGAGVATGRLEALLERGELMGDPERELTAFAADAARLEAIRAELALFDPAAAAAADLRDPARVEQAESLLRDARARVQPPPAPSPHWHLDALLEGAGSRDAIRAARAAAQDPGARHNPLLLHGRPGNGRTHLLHGLGNLLVERGMVVGCIGAAEFHEALEASLEDGTHPRWRAMWRRADALLLDDVHLLAGRERSQEELLLLVDDLLRRARPVVVTSAAAPADLAALGERVRSRITQGLVVELPAPDRELRLRVIERLLSAKLDAVDPELPGYLASRPAESVRATLALVERVLHVAEARESTPTAALAREILDGPPPRPVRRAQPERGSGVVAASAGGVRSREKMVWEWPDTTARIIEEWR